ncbi:BT4734/BF3469 family protein [Aegicerativicinus sediminis]|uniref:BT4734/BF3469 family protein n=1 Tax=Aegicerativicinus sediminis TaxID=2893202 RepID=UPI001E5FDF55|nr:BT4734/BF3469 family protein [Aegicerativicinus sediminis]
MYNPEISAFKSIYKTDVPYIIPLKKSFDRIRAGKSKDLIERIRKGDKELKKELVSVVYAGVFSKRNAKGLRKHSGLMALDFDSYPSRKAMASHMELLKQNPHFIGLFISPSGNGIKGIIRVSDKLDKETHPKVFKAFQKKFKYDYLDMSGSDVNRVCFESYDPDIYTNYEAEIFDPVIQDEGHEYASRPALMPLTNEDLIIERIMNWNWKRDFVEGERNNFIFDLAGAFCEYGVSQTTAEGYILNNIVIGFPEREAIATINSAYKKRAFDSKYFEDYKRIDRIRLDIKNLPKKNVVEKHNISEKDYEEIKETEDVEDFWFRDERNNIKIDPYKYKLFLERELGYKKYFPSDKAKPIYVHIKSNIVKEVSIEKIKDSVLNYLLYNGEIDVWKRCVNYANLFSDNYLDMLDAIDLVMLRDKKHESYIAFKNGIVRITKDTIELTDFMDFDGYVWESHIIDRNFKLKEKYENDFKTFVENVSDKSPLPIECVIGYLLSTYKNKTNNKAIILNDEVMSENPEGGTGKGLFVQGIKQIRRVSILDGKAFDDKKSFPYQTVSQDTHVLVFDDVKKNFDFESKFSLVTEGITIERKNKDAIKLTVEESPKMAISTNYAIKGEGHSHNRRRHEIEFSQYYGKDITPYDEFGHQLFDDWDDKQYNAFDNYMIRCLQSYLKVGLVKQTTKNLKLRKFVAETSYEFYEWIQDDSNFPLNERNTKTLKYNQFLEEYQDFKRWLSRKKFAIWVQKYAKMIEMEYIQGNTNGERWFMLQGQEPNDVKNELKDEIDGLTF